MQPLDLILLVAMGVTFVIWVVLMARALWMLTQRSLGRLDETGGGYFRWMGLSLGSISDFFTSPKDRPERRRIILVTILLFAIIIGRMFLLVGAA